MFPTHKFSGIAIVIILCLYLIFPSGLSTGDAWYYAASVKYNNELFHPHHLLYNALGLIFSWLPAKTGYDTLVSLKVMNALFAFMSLIIVQKILYVYKIDEKKVIIISCLIGLTFSILRYATENETYIVPLFFALLASLNWVKYITDKSDRFALYAGLWAAISVLFHEIYIFWWFGLLTGLLTEKRKRPALLYFMVSMIGPIVYLVIILINKAGTDWNSVISFLLGDFGKNASLGLTWKGLSLSFINLIRSFIQVHGYIYNMVRENLLLVIPGIISIFFVFLALIKYPGIKRINISTQFITVHIIIIVSQFLFALLSYGNAEFMVMIPVLIFMIVPFFAENYEKFLLRILIAMSIWNISYGLIPLHFKDHSQEDFICNAVLSKVKLIIVASDDQLIKNMLYYKTGEENQGSVFRSPASMKIRGEDPGVLEGVIDNALNSGIEIFTNCLEEEAISRQTITEGNQNKDFFRKYQTRLIKSWTRSTGTKSVYKIEKKL